MRVLVTGASGFVGGHVLGALRRAGHDPVLPPPDGGGRRAEISEVADWAWPQGVDAVVHLAASQDMRDPETLRRINVEGTRHLTERALRERVRRIVLVSTLHVHGLRADHQPHREGDALAPRSPYAESKRAAEEAFWAALGTERERGVVLRPAPVFGPSGRGRLAAVMRLAATPLPLPVGGLDAPRSLLAVDHLAEIVLAALERGAAGGGTFLAAESEPISLAGLVKACRSGLGRPARVVPAGRPVLEALPLVGGRFARAFAGLDQPDVADTHLLQSRLGWRSPRPLAATLARHAAAMRAARPDDEASPPP